jgi:hypothetical protein
MAASGHTCRPNESHLVVKALITIIRYAWPSPATMLGLLLALIAMCLGARSRLVNGVLEVAGGRLSRAFAFLPRFFHFEAITFGHVIIGLDHPLLALVRTHEHVHVRQYERWGALLIPLYLCSSIIQLLRGRDPYLENRFEREAFAKGALPPAGGDGNGKDCRRV